MLEHVRSPAAIGGLRLAHRIVMGAMHLGLESRDDGGVALAAFYAERARAGAGLMVTGGSAVSRVGAGGRNYSFVNSAGDQPRLKRVADAVHDVGGLIALQLFHAGRYGSADYFGIPPVAPSAIYSRFSRCEPKALSAAQIADTIDDFARGARNARELGFDAVEIMASEGYLIDQFLSPLTNQRDDAWGGDAPRRMRFGVEVLAAVRRAVGADFPVIFRFTGADLMPGGVPADEVLDYARALATAGADALNVGVGWHEAPVPTVQAIVPPGTWVPAAAAVKKAVAEVPVIASNRINRLELAESVLAGGEVDFVSMARPFLADAELMTKAGTDRPVNICIACNQACIDRSLDDAPVSCMVNPRAGRETEFPAVTISTARRIAVVGGGPAGLQAAHAAASAGNAVDLYEGADALGGQFRLACRVPGKADYAATVDYFASELQRLGVNVHLAHSIVDGKQLRGYDEIIVATGVRPRPVDIPGAEHAITYPEAFSDSALGERVAIIGGGGIAVDLAHFASQAPSPRQVTILHRGKRTAPNIGKSTRWVVLAELRRQGVRIVPQVRYERIEPGAMHGVDAEGEPLVIEVDTVVIAAGQVRDTTVADLLTEGGIAYRVIGGARDAVGVDAVRAFAEGLAAAR